MSISSNKKNKIKEYMLDKVGENEDVVQKTSDTFGISKTTVYRYLEKLIEQGSIKRKKRGRYGLVETKKVFNYTNIDLEEDVVFLRDIKPVLEEQNLAENVMNIWYYAFTEMFNNAIEHSEAKKIICVVVANHASTRILIFDSGIGIFNKIQKYYNYESLDDAIGELFKGKLTTDSENHTGEGIFFTSRLMDTFITVSSKKYFSHNNYYEVSETLNDSDLLNKLIEDRGTIVYMQLANRSHKQIKEVFDMFSSTDTGFNKTNIPMKNVFGNNFPVSRSQAKRLYNRLDKFDEVELDFLDVDEIGQAFAHELFVKFANAHKGIKITVSNANKDVQGMIDRVKNTK